MKNHVLLKDAAADIGVTPGRLRQLCVQHEIGQLITPRLRILSPADVKNLKSMINSFTPRRPRKNSEQGA